MQPDGENISGDELVETGASENTETASGSGAEGTNPSVKKRKTRWHRYGLPAFVLLALASGIVFFSLKSPHPPAAKPATAPVAEQPLTRFDAFVVPFNDDSDHGYILISLSFYAADPSLERELAEKRYRLRGAVYDLLKRRSERPDWSHELEALKKDLKKTVNENLSTGRITELYITQFLVV